MSCAHPALSRAQDFNSWASWTTRGSKSYFKGSKLGPGCKFRGNSYRHHPKFIHISCRKVVCVYICIYTYVAWESASWAPWSFPNSNITAAPHKVEAVGNWRLEVGCCRISHTQPGSRTRLIEIRKQKRHLSRKETGRKEVAWNPNLHDSLPCYNWIHIGMRPICTCVASLGVNSIWHGHFEILLHQMIEIREKGLHWNGMKRA